MTKFRRSVSAALAASNAPAFDIAVMPDEPFMPAMVADMLKRGVERGAEPRMARATK